MEMEEPLVLIKDNQQNAPGKGPLLKNAFGGLSSTRTEPVQDMRLMKTPKLEFIFTNPSSKKTPAALAAGSKGSKIIESYSKDYVFTFTDGFSDVILENGGICINFTFPPSRGTKQFEV
ncbi:hypothetical protein TNIN_117971 [Trichonephila inaurata madagascariensis]|uniref:Uncharacterized protein n=1 Tax=Trichonephila inaurata madagascariensis TaxID=2747483 RepID=A0A8X7CM10_9ARAC|nr:hypothetical protein TNIN_117971 [Trichonephila inaurata madagascariensis]